MNTLSRSIMKIVCASLLTAVSASAQWTTGAGSIFYNSGNVGIGTTGPLSPLSVSGQVVIGNPYRGDASLHVYGSYGGYGRLTQIHPATASQPALNLMASTDANTNYAWWAWGVNNGYWSITPGASFGASGLFIDYAGNVGIGATPTLNKLSVNGTIQAKEVVVNTGWADYVFSSEYRLKNLNEISAFVKEHHRLPGIPSAAEVREKGVGLADMQVKLLAKVEELTLYAIEAQKRSEKVEQQNADLLRRIAALESAGTK